jgi:hypothetical protein
VKSIRRLELKRDRTAVDDPGCWDTDRAANIPQQIDTLLSLDMQDIACLGFFLATNKTRLKAWLRIIKTRQNVSNLSDRLDVREFVKMVWNNEDTTGAKT